MRFDLDDQLGRQNIATLGIPCKCPHTITAVDLMEKRIRLVQVIARAVVEVASVVIRTPVVEKGHGSFSCASLKQRYVRAQWRTETVR